LLVRTVSHAVAFLAHSLASACLDRLDVITLLSFQPPNQDSLVRAPSGDSPQPVSFPDAYLGAVWVSSGMV